MRNFHPLSFSSSGKDSTEISATNYSDNNNSITPKTDSEIKTIITANEMSSNDVTITSFIGTNNHEERDVDGFNDQIVVSTSSSSSSSAPEEVEDRKELRQSRRIAIGIIVLGLASSIAFLVLGISSLKDTEQSHYERFSFDLYNTLRGSLDDYLFAASIVHNRCRSHNCSRQDFRDIYDYIVSDNFYVHLIDYKPRVLHSDRAFHENESREYYAKYYPHVNYTGFTGFNFENSTEIEPRLVSDVYYPVHYLEPVEGNEVAIDFDFYASGTRRKAVDVCLQTKKPCISDRLRLIQEKKDEVYGVVMLHPGVNVSTNRDTWPSDLASVVVRIPDLLKRSTEFQTIGTNIYLYDQMVTNESVISPTFLGAIKVNPKMKSANVNDMLIPEIPFSDLGEGVWIRDFSTANKVWSLAVVPIGDPFKSTYAFVILGGVTIFISSLFLAQNVHARTYRMIRYNQLNRQAESEKAALIIENARQTTKSERELNDFIAHEVRNPVAAAIAACSFVSRTSMKERSTVDNEQWNTMRGDVKIISNSLNFINDLLRSILDIHRASSQQLAINLETVDVVHDVLEPVQSILHSHDKKVQIRINCEDGLQACADKLRLKQIMMNLGRNSSKFVDHGFIQFTAKRLKSDDSNDLIEFSVEDSGPGIPLEKREHLFTKFQDSLDGLAQGTGIGLYLCKKLVLLMGGTLCLDESYNSGVPGCPGTRITFSLKASSPLKNPLQRDGYRSSEFMTLPSTQVNDNNLTLPEGLSILFVDDDTILRKLFSRVVKSVSPTSTIRQASNGETALVLTETETFDIIFMDMYMASVEKQLLGTETVVALRAKGVTSCICGLSANDKESEFMEAGADFFMFKPFPCDQKEVTRTLLNILHSRDDKQ